VSRYQKKHSLTHTRRGHQISYLLPPFTTIQGILPIQSMRFTVFFHNLSLQVFVGLPLGLAPSTSYSIHFFIQSLSSFYSTCPYHRNLCCCSSKIISPNPSLSLNSLLKTPSCSFTPHIHLTILIHDSSSKLLQCGDTHYFSTHQIYEISRM